MRLSLNCYLTFSIIFKYCSYKAPIICLVSVMKILLKIVIIYYLIPGLLYEDPRKKPFVNLGIENGWSLWSSGLTSFYVLNSVTNQCSLINGGFQEGLEIRAASVMSD